MWSQTQNHTPGQSQGVNHDQASMMAHVAARKAAVMKALQGGAPNAVPGGIAAGAPPGSPVAPGAAPAPAPPAAHKHSFKAHIAAAGAARGVPLGMADIHGAIDTLTKAGKFSPVQGEALKAHNGPLHGKAGVSTMHAITHQALSGAGQ
jgi:hypothetical protein